MRITEIKGLSPTKVCELDTERGRQCKSLAESLNNLARGKSLNVLILGSVSFGICKEGTEIGRSYDGKIPIYIERVEEGRYLVKKENNSLIIDLNLKTEWCYSMIERFGENFPSVSCKLIKPTGSTAYIY